MAGLTEAEVQAAQHRNLYWRGQVMPRRRQILGKHLWFPVVGGISLVLSCVAATTIAVPISDVAGFGMTYATLSLAACVTGVVLAIGLPSGERLKQWALNRAEPSGFSVYSNLVFALTWAGMAQILILLVCMAALVIGGNEVLLPENPKPSHVALLAGAVAAFSYAVNQLLVLMYTFSQIGNVIDSDEWSHRDDDSAEPPPSTGEPVLLVHRLLRCLQAVLRRFF